MTPMVFGHIAISDLVFFVLNLFCELQDNGVLKNLKFFPQSLPFFLELWLSNLGYTLPPRIDKK